MAKLFFPCGCSFNIVDNTIEDDIYSDVGEDIPLIDISTDPRDPNSIYRVNPNCDLTWDLICSGATKGIFQLETQLGQNWAAKAKPRSIEELGVLGAILRPGCLRAMSGDPPKSMSQRYVDRKNGEEEVDVLHPVIEECLRKTLGILVFQEEAMSIAKEVAGFSEEEADTLRKAIGKKKADVMSQVKTSFVEKSVELGKASKEEAEEIFSWIEASSRYSFNKCLSPTSVVETKEGNKLLSEVEIGDYVLSPNGFVEVLDVIYNGEREVYEIEFESGKTLECTLDHQLLCNDDKKYTVKEIFERNLNVVEYTN